MLSAVILAKNSASSLGKTLASLSWVTDSIVIDDFSTDKTESIAKRYHARVYQRHLRNDFSGQRNFGLQKAKGDWVFFVDSDEIVTEELKNEISRKIHNQSKINGFFVKRKDYFYGRELRHGETAHVTLLRLAKKDAGKWIRPVHEVWDVNGPTHTLTYPLLHYPHPDVAQFISEINTYTTINASYLNSIGEKSSLFHIVAYPAGKFFQNYFMKLGFLDGTAGFVIAMLMSFHSFLTRAKLYMLTVKR